ncbi:unnamed protein product [Coffea canephora]|uniref:SMP domain-containing protein n=1 Tax=Coffea canephora TaxID=49390 RepID=A0A068U7Q3_COFCA|nr:unnamed protein product [Coffea canephora]
MAELEQKLNQQWHIMPIIKLSDVLARATSKFIDDKPVTREAAEGVIGAETRDRPDMTTHPGGVAASAVAAAGVNKDV